MHFPLGIKDSFELRLLSAGIKVLRVEIPLGAGVAFPILFGSENWVTSIVAGVVSSSKSTVTETFHI